ncbi:hypothetical protein ACAG24_022545 [Mycobacterium sp. pW049]|uniref:hypothetical protein n=1 Tax=[Mycobacterium] bulgaricum TaxID=3238985 RepID=UPI00351BD12B
MTASASQTGSTHSRYIGRVGALAAALGIGMALVAAPGAALADGADGSRSAAQTTKTSETARGADDDAATGADTDSDGATSTEADRDDADSETDGTGDTGGSAAGPDASENAAGELDTDGTQIKPAPSPGSDVTQRPDSDPIDGDGEQPSTSAGSSPNAPTPTPGVSTSPVAMPSATTSAVADSDSATDSAGTSRVKNTVAETAPTAIASDASDHADSDATGTAPAVSADAVSDGRTPPASAQTTTSVELVNRPTGLILGVASFFNNIVTTLLDPFLAPAPDTSEPFTPLVWGVLGWVRRNVFNEAPTVNGSPTTLTLGPTVTGVLATDPESDRLTYRVNNAIQKGSEWHTDTGVVVINETANTFTFTPYEADPTVEQQHSFTVTVSDGKRNLLSLLGIRHADRQTVTVAVKPVAADRVSESRAGAVSGNATVTETQQQWCPSGTRCFAPDDETLTIRTVTYDNFADGNGFVLNGTETKVTNADLSFMHYLSDIALTDNREIARGFLQADARLVDQASLTGYVVSAVDGDLQGLTGDPVPAEVTVNFDDEQGPLHHTERFNQFHVSTTFAEQRPEDVKFLNEIGLHGTLFRAWLNSPNQTEKTCTGAASVCELSPSMKAYLKDLGDASDAQLANFRLSEHGQLLTQAEMRGILLAVKREQPEIVFIEAWNEPDQPAGGVDGGVTPDVAYAQYRALYRAINSVNEELAAQDANYLPLKVGGPSLFYFNKRYLEAFLDLYVADPDPAKRLDFISYHGYLEVQPNGARKFFKEDPSLVKNYRDDMDAILSARGLPTNTPVFVSETGIYPGPLCDNCDSTDYSHQAAGMAALHYWFTQQHDTYVINWVARRQGLKDQFVTQNAVGPQLDLTDPRNPGILWQPLDPVPTNALTPYGNLLLMQSMMEDVRVSAVSDQLNGGLGVYALAAKDPVLPEASLMVWNYPGCSGTPGTTSCGNTTYETSISMGQLPNGLGEGPVTVTVYRVDQHTSNFWENPLNTDIAKAKLEQVEQRTVTPVNGRIDYQAVLLPNSVYLVSLRKVV